MAVGLHQAGRALAARRERAQHAEREVDADIVVARRDERPADPTGAGAEIEHAWVRHRGRLEHRSRGRPAATPSGKRAIALEARRERVIGGLSNLHDSPSFQQQDDFV